MSDALPMSAVPAAVWAPTAVPDTTLRLRVTTFLRISLFLVLAGNLGRLNAFSTGDRSTAFTVIDFSVGALLVLGALSMLRARSMRLDGVALAGIAFIALGALSTAVATPQYDFTPFEILVSTAYLVRWAFYFLIYIVTINVVRRADVDGIRRTFEAMVTAFAAFGLVQSAFFPNFAFMVYPEAMPYTEWDPQGQRLVSTFLDPNFAGMLLVMGLAWHLARMSTGAKVAIWKPTLLIAALFMSASRSSILALVVVIAVIVLIRGVSARMLKAFTAGVVALGALSPWLIEMVTKYQRLQVNGSAVIRVIEWTRGLNVFLQHPVLGIGFNTWAFVQERSGYERLMRASYAIDGGLLFIAILTGLVGLSVFLVLIGIVGMRARTVWRDRTRSPDDRALAIASFAIFAGLCFHALFNNSLFLPLLLEPLWIICGLAFVVAHEPDRVVQPTAIAVAAVPVPA